MISLLGREPSLHRPAVATSWADDLLLPPIVRALCLDARYAGQIQMILTDLCPDPATIVYRQEVLEDLLRLPELATRLEMLLPRLAGLAHAGSSRWDDAGVFQVTARLAELELYVECLQGLLTALEAVQTGLQAAGWRDLLAELRDQTTTPAFRSLQTELPELRARIEHAGSVTVGINLDAQLRPESATLLGIHAGRFEGPRSLLGRLLRGEAALQASVTPLRLASDRQPFGPERRLFQDLSYLLEEVTTPVAQALARYTQIESRTLAGLEGELAFYLGARQMITQLQAAGYALCRPEIVPCAVRICQVRGAYNLELLLRLHSHSVTGENPPMVVPNDISFDDAGRVFVLTGPNRGGKTTFTRAVGQVQMLGQAGLYVPGSAARISPVDQIFTLFPEAEQVQTGMGRLDEEAARLAEIFRAATPHSLVLLNEPLASTSPAEATGIARDLLSGLRLLGARALIVTHLHNLAHELPALNAATVGRGVLGSLVAGAEQHDGEVVTRTYRITPGIPAGQSYAADIAAQHGLHLSQITRTLRERGLGE
ncbi:MAG: MutS-related protein [Chloroflexaceae bacterium]